MPIGELQHTEDFKDAVGISMTNRQDGDDNDNRGRRKELKKQRNKEGKKKDYYNNSKHVMLPIIQAASANQNVTNNIRSKSSQPIRTSQIIFRAKSSSAHTRTSQIIFRAKVSNSVHHV